MSATAWVAAVLLALLGSGAIAWAWLAVARIEQQLRDLGGFEGMHFET